MYLLLWTVLAVSIALAIHYFRWVKRLAGHLRAVLKTVPVLLLVLYAGLCGAPALLVAALALGALGDACLAYEGEPAFVAGLSAFLASHIAYAALFWPLIEPSLLFTSAWRYTAAWIFVVLTSMTLFMLWRPAGRLAIPVAAYGIAIIAMALSALAVKPILPAAGAALFVMSDTALAIQKFLVKPDAPVMARLKPFVWSTYFAAQLIFTLAIAGLPSA
ncbi:lysoplasmalogenase family protein [Neorhizobium galegae]|uniref:Putative membrane protein n=1 Tax=Neorhizobium galegae bv. officinalis TaxID=323656 RepID=A0A0T7GYK7_NEOGA|nr:lysoplasmalogenase family protein [Neorhizobium galegae]CDZ52227.1 Putative membrane protein [Neorhizobium galegae bv. officinalis]